MNFSNPDISIIKDKKVIHEKIDDETIRVSVIMEFIEKIGYGNLPICIAKTQYSFSDDPDVKIT